VTAVPGQAESFESDPDSPLATINHEVGATFQHTFRKAGVFDYLCRVHPRFMRGSVTVRAVPDDEALPHDAQSRGRLELARSSPASARSAGSCPPDIFSQARVASSPRAASFNGWCLARLAAVRAVASWRAMQWRAKPGKLAPRSGR